jgi:hypothetical protein
MKNRWSDAARAAALAVRKARAFAANPQDKGKAVPQPGGRAPKPMAPKPTVFAGGSATFDESTGKRIPEKNIWIPPPNDPHWNDPAFVESFKRGVAERKKTGLAAGTFPTKPNIFYSSSYPYGPGQEGRVMQGIFRYDPVNPVDAAKLGYNMGDGKKSMPPKRPPVKPPVKPTIPTKTGVEKIGTTKIRVVIAGKRYTKVGNMYYPDTSPPPAKKLLAASPKRK